MRQKILFSTALIAAVVFGGVNFFKWRSEYPITSEIHQPEYFPYLNEVREKFMCQMFEEHQLICIGDRGKLHETVEEVGLKFKAYHRATIAEARALQITVMNKFVDAINQHPQLKSYLDVRPFTYKRVKIGISFEGPNGEYADGVGWVFNVTDLAGVVENRNKIFYNSFDPYKAKHFDLHEETYEEAVKLAKEHLEMDHHVTSLEQDMDATLYAFSQKMVNQHKIECWHIGGSLSDSIGAKFVCRSKMSQQKARQLLLSLANTLLDDINGKLKEYLDDAPFQSNRLKLSIWFTRTRPNDLSEVTLEDDQITYMLDPRSEQPISMEEPFPAHIEKHHTPSINL